MPKNPKHLTEIQNQRLKNKQKISKFVPGKVSLQVLGTGAKGAPRSLYVFSDHSRYLFNCGEGTQRLAHELKLKLSKVDHIFITHPTWQNLGGLPGTSLTMQDVGVPLVNVHGPSGLQEMFDASRKFVVLKNLKIKIVETNPTEIFEDNVMKVQYVVLTRHLEPLSDESEMVTDQSSVHSRVDTGTNSMTDENTAGKQKRSRSISSYLSDDSCSSTSSGKSKKRRRHRKNRSRSLSLANSSLHTPHLTTNLKDRSLNGNEEFYVMKEKGISMCYICRLQPRPGALSLEKCVSFGVPPGPLLGKLKSGEDVTLANGTIVKSEQVCDPHDPGPTFIVLDCPTEEYIESLINHEGFKKHQKFADNDEDVASVVVHFTPKKVMDDPRYQAWMNLFVPSTQHLILNETNTCMGSMSVHRIQHKLNMIHQKIFPLLKDNGTQLAEEEKVSMNQEATHRKNSDCETNLISANTLSAIHLRPKKGLDRTEEIKLKPSEFVQETVGIEGFQSSLLELKERLQARGLETDKREYPNILFLGTGSCIPNKTRNTSGILLETGTNQKLLLDCGEGTYGQLVRFFGVVDCDEILADVNAVYISHIHADHHIGLIGFLQGRRRALKKLSRKHKPVLLMAPIQLLSWLNEYDRKFERISQEFEFIANSDLLYTGHTLMGDTYQKMKATLNIQEISTCFVKHCPNAFGVALTLSDGSKITYSGDTMPCQDLVTLGQESDLLIHEATMEDDLEHEAIIKMHSTTTQAIEIGKKMGAKYILLTHFSQRYAKLPRFNENFGDNVGIAFDNMHVRLDDLELLPLFNSTLKLMFAEHYDEMELKALKRQLRNEKENDFIEKRKMQKIQ